MLDGNRAPASLLPCAWPPGTSTPSVPASTASWPSWSVRTSTPWRCRRSSAAPTSSRSSPSRPPATSWPSTGSTSGTGWRSPHAWVSTTSPPPSLASPPGQPSPRPSRSSRPGRWGRRWVRPRMRGRCACGACMCPTAASSPTRTTRTSSTGCGYCVTTSPPGSRPSPTCRWHWRATGTWRPGTRTCGT